MTFFSLMLTVIFGASLSVLVSVISAVASLPASSVTLSWSLPSSVSLSQVLTVLEEPSAGRYVSVTLQVEDTSSLQVATDSSPILSSLPESVTEGPAITFREVLETVMTGALVSFAGVGSTGVTGVGGVGSTGSGPPQENAKVQASSVATRFFATAQNDNLGVQNDKFQRIFLNNVLDGMPCGNAVRGAGTRPLAEGR